MKIILILFFVWSYCYPQTGYSKDQWEWLNPLPQGHILNVVHTLDSLNAVAAGEFGSILRTSNGGKSWKTVPTFTQEKLLAFEFINDVGYCVGENGTILKTTDGGSTWNKLNINTTKSFRDVSFLDEKTGMIVGVQGAVYKTTDGGENWIDHSYYVPVTLFSVSLINDSVCFLGAQYYVLKTTNGGINWNILNQLVPLPDEYYVKFMNDDVALALVNDRFDDQMTMGYILITRDGGSTWEEVFEMESGFRTPEVSFIDQNHFIIVSSGKVIRSTDSGTTWNYNLIHGYLNTASIKENTGYAAGWYGKIAKTTDYGETWHNTTSGYHDIIIKVAFSDENTGVAIRWTAGDYYIHRTTDGGRTWIEKERITKDLYNIYLYGDLGFALGSNILLKTTDSGEIWVEKQLEYNEKWYSISFLDKNNGLMGGTQGTLLKTSDGGFTWSKVNTGLNNYMRIKEIIYVSETQIILGTTSGVYKSSDNGLSWNHATPDLIYGMTFIDQYNGIGLISKSSDIYYRPDGCIMRTTDGGNTWIEQLKLPYHTFTSLVLVDNNTWYTFGNKNHYNTWNDYGYIWKTADGGITWVPDFEIRTINSLSLAGKNTLFAAGYWGALLKKKIISVPASSDDENSEITFNLHNNYPNPFNPSTKIKYSIPYTGRVIIKIYDALGRELKTLVDNEKSQGTYTVDFDAGNLSSGIYYYQIRTGEFIETKKMMLVK